jgi:hypothetical protein
MRSLAGAAAIAFTLLLGRAANAQVDITINGNGVDVNPSPIVQDGRVFVPLRGVFERLGASVVYNNGQINATRHDRDVSLDIGQTQATVDGQSETIDVAPFIVGESTFVPLRFISQALGASVNWNEGDRTVEIGLSGAPEYQADAQQQNDADGDWVDAPPPPIPYYEPPPVQDPNEIWVPGYWAWGEAGYYWVPGFWAQPPQTGYYWTPGYWAANNNAYVWHAGYWGLTIGFYGGINYGAGYYGHGYVGGRWSGDTFRYNTAVTPVNARIKSVYVDRSVVINNTTVNRVSYNGGSKGVQARPTSGEAAAARAPHRAPTAQQQQQVHVAATDRRFLATVNAGKPPVVAAPKPFTPAAKPAGFAPVTPTDRAAGARLVTRPGSAPAPAAAPARPAYVRPARPVLAAPAPVSRPAPAAQAVSRPAPIVRAAPAAAPVRPAPAAMPVYVHHAPPIAAAPAVRYAAPVMRAPPPQQQPRAVAPHGGAPAQPRPERSPGR